MRKIFSFLALIAILSLSSCVYSLFPFYTDETIVYYPELNGKWSYEDGSFLLFEPFEKENDIMIDLSNIDFTGRISDDNQLESEVGGKTDEDEKAETRSYKMTLKDDESTFVYLTHLFQIGEYLYLDLYPWLEEGVHQVKGDQIVVDNLFPVHTVMKIELEDKKLSLIQFDLNKLHNLFKSHLIRLRHEMVNDEVLITAKSEEIQKFLKNYVKDPSVYESTEVYTKTP